GCRITRLIGPGTLPNDAASPPTSRRISPPLAKAFVLRNASSSPTTSILQRNPHDPFHHPTGDQVQLVSVADIRFVHDPHFMGPLAGRREQLHSANALSAACHSASSTMFSAKRGQWRSSE